MSFQKFLIASIVFASQSLMAQVLTLGPGLDSVPPIQGVTISASATTAIQGRTSSINHFASALRTDLVGFLHVNVYVGQLFATDATKICSTQNAFSLVDDPSETTEAVVMTFLRAVDEPTVLTNIQNSLVANNVDATNPAVAGFLTAVQNGGDALSGANLVIVGEKLADGTEAVTYQNGAGTPVTTVGPAGFRKSILSIWLGNPAAGDSDLATFIQKVNACGSN